MELVPLLRGVLRWDHDATNGWNFQSPKALLRGQELFELLHPPPVFDLLRGEVCAIRTSRSFSDSWGLTGAEGGGKIHQRQLVEKEVRITGLKDAC